VWQRVFDEYKSVGSAWNKDSIVTFDLPELDSTKRYDLFINLRDNNYQYNNLFWLCLLKKQRLYKSRHLRISNGKPDGTLLGNGFTDMKVNCF
jgi:gliding motility-associated lipoprotein GldH